MSIVSRNPVDGEFIASFDELTPDELENKLARAQNSFESWRYSNFDDRSQLVKSLAAVLRDEARAFGELATLEMGKPITQAMAEVEKCAWVCEHYAEHAAKYLDKEKIETDATESFVRFDPLGPVLAVMPWNFPFWQVFRFAAPAIMAGNVGLLKHASNTPQCGMAIEEAFLKAGFPEGVFQNLMLGSSRIADLIDHGVIKAVTLTGSEHAGSKVAEAAGRCLKKTVLELGGSDAFIVLADADIPSAAQIAADARLQNNGQSCIAAKRFIVVESAAAAFTAALKSEFEKKIIGDPMKPEMHIGPLATEQILNDLERQVTDSVKAGAEVVTGGKRREEKGYFYEPTILKNVTNGMPVYNEETFGPVAAVITVKDEEAAIAVANDTRVGLGASVWTANPERAKREIAPRLEAGAVFINGMVKSDPRLPFGGIKKSGYGRELGEYGIKEFVNIKTVWVA